MCVHVCVHTHQLSIMSEHLCKRRPSPSSLPWPSQHPCHRSWPHSPCALCSRCLLTCRRTCLRPPRWLRPSRRPSRCHPCLCSHSLTSPRRYRPPADRGWGGAGRRMTVVLGAVPLPWLAPVMVLGCSASWGHQAVMDVPLPGEAGVSRAPPQHRLWPVSCQGSPRPPLVAVGFPSVQLAAPRLVVATA